MKNHIAIKLILLIIVFLLAFGKMGYSIPIKDQENDPTITTSGSTGLNNFFDARQTFAVGITGTLTRVALQFGKSPRCLLSGESPRRFCRG
ncbi:MAG: hypothetical protein HON76_14705 [Candidatus Scalindua sp.]|nr:hypothetical protein [Candidatus Scalindua sp.]MBT5304471.1 hypothetical protein [Candidatus Scalindua sp.]MBT6225180.1 hypothetical protein [Candidatus Scalindua sp.]MBT6563768.1 hypothetical protein [Candidatus Scalindua sp.]MBT7210906.1 hypothetical protein [Candidatus Scalindua sp.]